MYSDSVKQCIIFLYLYCIVFSKIIILNNIHVYTAAMLSVNYNTCSIIIVLVYMHVM